MGKPRTDRGGNWPVMITPFNNDKSIDWNSFDRLTDWYIKSGAKGLFAVCQSSEMQFLSDDERVALADRLVQRVGDQLPIIATGTLSYDVDQQAEMIKRLYATGIDAVICLTNYLATEQESDQVWLDNCQHLLAKTDDIPLGLYECPLPYKRLLTEATTQVLADSGRFYWYKETSEDASKVLAKTHLSAASNLQIYNAHSGSLLETLRGGCAGFTGISANFYPALFSWLCDNYQQESQQVDQLNEFLAKSEPTVCHKYPCSAKQYLYQLGVIDTPVARVAQYTFDSAEQEVLRVLHKNVDEWMNVLGLRS